jgi:hypothetical protein
MSKLLRSFQIFVTKIIWGFDLDAIYVSTELRSLVPGSVFKVRQNIDNDNSTLYTHNVYEIVKLRDNRNAYIKPIGAMIPLPDSYALADIRRNIA